MDFKGLKPSDTRTVVIKNPITGEGSDMTVTLFGSHSETYENIRRELVLESTVGDDFTSLSKAEQAIKIEETSKVLISKICGDWSNAVFDGKEIKFSESAVLKKIQDYKWFYEQLDRASTEYASFFQNPESD